MAFKLAGVSSASTGSGGVGTGVGGGGLSYEDFLNEWNWCWIAQGKTSVFYYCHYSRPAAAAVRRREP